MPVALGAQSSLQAVNRDMAEIQMSSVRSQSNLCLLLPVAAVCYTCSNLASVRCWACGLAQSSDTFRMPNLGQLDVCSSQRAFCMELSLFQMSGVTSWPHVAREDNMLVMKLHHDSLVDHPAIWCIFPALRGINSSQPHPSS